MKNDNINHFIFSRFNIYLRENLVKYKWDISEEEWMQKHIASFTNGLVQSLKNQSCQNFLYVCFFDGRTPEIYRRDVESSFKGFKNFIPIFIDLPHNQNVSANIHNSFLRDYQKKYIKKICGEDRKKIILQTRVDIDDYIHKDSVNILQRNVNYYYEYQFRDNLKRHANKEFLHQIISVYFPYGYYINLSNEPLTFFRVHKDGNQFCTIVQNNSEDIIGIWDRDHFEWGKITTHVLLDISEPMWIWTIHDNNFGYRKVKRFKKDNFLFPCEYIKEIFDENFSFNPIYTRYLLNNYI